jgi:hypothetical protein
MAQFPQTGCHETNFYTIDCRNNKERLKGGTVDSVRKLKIASFSFMGEPQIFFDEKGFLITIVYKNDGNWRGEYFNLILKHYGVKVEEKFCEIENTELERAIIDCDEKKLKSMVFDHLFQNKKKSKSMTPDRTM